ncbi:MAG: alpha/beta hydrolase [Cloacibacterium normanense]
MDFRGYGKSSGIPTHLNIAKDGQQFFNYLKNKKKSRIPKIILYGTPMGSQIATHLAKENSKDISMLILRRSFYFFHVGDLACSYKPEAKDMIKKYLVSPYILQKKI